MEVPGNVGINSVGAHGLESTQPVLPQIGVNAEVVDGSGKDAIRFTRTVEDGVVVAQKGVVHTEQISSISNIYAQVMNT